MNPTQTVTVSNLNEFFARIPTTHKHAKIRIDRRPTIEVGFRSVQDKHGNAEINACAKRIEHVARWLVCNGQRRAQTESGDVWSVKPNPQRGPNQADFIALPY